MENMFHPAISENVCNDQLQGSKITFQYHAASYLLMNLVFWLGWFMSGHNVDPTNGVVWPLYPMLFGAAGLLCHFLTTYVFTACTDTEN